MGTINGRGTSASSVASNLGSGRKGNSEAFKQYQNELKNINARMKYQKLSEKNEKKAQQWREKQDKKEAQQAQKERLLDMANARKIAQQEKGSFKDRIDDWATAWKEQKKEQLETTVAQGGSLKEVLKASFSYGAAAVGKGILDGASALAAGVGKAISSATKSVDESADLYAKYMSEVDARIQGAYSGMDFSSLNDILVNNTSGNPYIKYTDAVENLSKFVEEGIANNLIQRTFLATISDKIATTFDAFDASLLRIIRIQRQDTTAARLGMEAELTKLFNYYFSDTSYLSGAFDDVTSALTDLSAQMSGSTAVEFEYMVQKWLGTLGESGVSDSTLSSIAQAINALGTGDVDYLTSNTQMQNLLVLSANAAGLNYGDMLVNGISSQDANDLLYNLILYVRKQVSGANNVVKAKYADLFGLTMADVAAIENLNTSSINSLREQAMTYNDTLQSLSEQIAQVPSRMHYSEMVNNVMENIMSATGMSVADNAGAYLTYKIADLVEGITGGIKIPTISVFGSSITLPNSIEEYMKIGVTGYGLISALGGALSNWMGSSALDISRWSSTYDKGSSYGGFVNADQLDTSTSATGFVTNTNTKGIQQSIVDEQESSAKDIRGDENESESDIMVVLKELKRYFDEGGSASKPLRVTVQSSTTDTTSINASGNAPMDLTTIAQKLLEIVMSKGEYDDPVIVAMSASSPETNPRYDGLPGGAI